MNPTTREILELGQAILTPRQFECLRLCVADYSVSRIALAMDISETRARVLQRRVYQKLAIELEKKEAA